MHSLYLYFLALNSSNLSKALELFKDKKQVMLQFISGFKDSNIYNFITSLEEFLYSS